MLLGFCATIQNETVSNIVYYLAFFIPIFLGIGYIFGNKTNTTTGNLSKAPLNDFKLKKDDVLFTLPIITPEILIVLVISALTGALMKLIGQENIASFEEPFIVALFTHALIPAVLEELLFRFIPIKLLSGEEKNAIIISSFMFAFAHASLFQIPYAFVAGLIFASVYIYTGNIFTSIAMHFMSNLFSLLTIYGFLGIWLWITFSALLVASLAVIFVRRKTYAEALKLLLSKEKITIYYPPIIFAILSLSLAISVFFA